jgi:anti-anti-sigma factor
MGADFHGVFICDPFDFIRLNVMRDEPLSYTVSDSHREGTTLVRLSGPLTLGNIFELQDELRRLTPPLTIFDLSGSEYMDSAGIGVLTNYFVSAEKNGRRMALAGVNHRIEALLDTTRVKSLLRVFATVEDAEANA